MGCRQLVYGTCITDLYIRVSSVTDAKLTTTALLLAMFIKLRSA